MTLGICLRLEDHPLYNECYRYLCFANHYYNKYLSPYVVKQVHVFFFLRFPACPLCIDNCYPQEVTNPEVTRTLNRHSALVLPFDILDQCALLFVSNARPNFKIRWLPVGSVDESWYLLNIPSLLVNIKYYVAIDEHIILLSMSTHNRNSYQICHFIGAATILEGIINSNPFQKDKKREHLCRCVHTFVSFLLILSLLLAKSIYALNDLLWSKGIFWLEDARLPSAPPLSSIIFSSSLDFPHMTA